VMIMNPIKKVLLVVLPLLVLAIIGSADSINLGGGTSISTSEKCQAVGVFTRDNTDSQLMLSSTSAVTLISNNWVEDRDGKRAEVLLNVEDGIIRSSRAILLPREGKTFFSWPSVYAQQYLSIVGAKKIETGSKAFNPAGQLSAETALVIQDDTQRASLNGGTSALASCRLAQANQWGEAQGKIMKGLLRSSADQTPPIPPDITIPSSYAWTMAQFSSTLSVNFNLAAAGYARPPVGFKPPRAGIVIMADKPLTTACSELKWRDDSWLIGSASGAGSWGDYWAAAYTGGSSFESGGKASAQ